MSGAPELLATYRLQLGPGLGFAQARALVPYLRALGVSHLYLSPALQARAGSTHGYDVIDPTRVSEALGGERELRALADAGLGVILDIVPNHMGVGEENAWWRDESVRARWFDLDPAGGYRRFFDIDDMAAIRQEDEEVFATSHAKVLELLREGVLDGLRVDHPDGLADPAGYLRRLRDAGAQRVWVEKILHPGEPLRDWPVSGTVGYEFLNDACALFVQRAALEPLTQLYAELTGETRAFADVALEAQLEQARGTFAREVARLERLGPFGFDELSAALARLPVYRTYVEPWSGAVQGADRDAVRAAGMDEALARALLLEADPPAAPELVTRFQQTSPAVAAKGVEDTAFYRHMRLLCLNEVGGDPDRFGLSVEAFHAANAQRAERFPQNLLVTQTHDTKRSCDTRARIGALSEMPERWGERARAWMQMSERIAPAGTPPDAPERYLIFQTLLGAWPISHERLDGYLVKALREGKRNSTWAEPDERYERAVLDFVHALLANEAFMRDFGPFCAEVARAGERSSLGQVLLKLACPGVPDIYQGDELWQLALVDPDNRRAVDWDARRTLLASLRDGAAPAPGARKLALIRAGLELRRRRSGAFAGAYTPLEADAGTCAFLRGEQEVLVIVRVQPGAGGGGALAEPPAGRWRELLSGRELRPRQTPSLQALAGRDGLALCERIAP